MMRKPDWLEAPGGAEDVLPAIARQSIEELISSDCFFLPVDEGDKKRLGKLLHDPLMRDVYSHLQQFDLDKSAWAKIIFEVFLHSYSLAGFKRDDQERLKSRKEKQLYADISRKAFELFYLLGEFNSSCETELGRFLTETGFQRELLRVVAASTSAKWVGSYYKWEAGTDALFYDSPLLDDAHRKKLAGIEPSDLINVPAFEEVKRQRANEMPQLSVLDLEHIDLKSLEKLLKNNGFPLPEFNSSSNQGSKSLGPACRYVDTALNALANISLRSFDASGLEAKHWKSIVKVLSDFDFGGEDRQLINILAKHKKQALRDRGASNI